MQLHLTTKAFALETTEEEQWEKEVDFATHWGDLVFLLVLMETA